MKGKKNENLSEQLCQKQDEVMDVNESIKTSLDDLSERFSVNPLNSNEPPSEE